MPNSVEDFQALRTEFVRKLIQQLGGTFSENGQIYVIQNPRGVSNITFDVVTKQIQTLAITKTFMFGPIDILSAIVTHEYANTLVDLYISPLDLYEVNAIQRIRMLEERWRMKSFAGFLRRTTRLLFETLGGGILRIAKRKIAVDRKAIELMRLHALPFKGYCDFLTEERNESAFYPFPRNLLYRWVGNKRIGACKALMRQP